MIVLDLTPGPGNKQLLIAGLPHAIDQCSNLIYGMRKAANGTTRLSSLNPITVYPQPLL